MKKIRLLTLLFLIPLMANAQGINGSWTGLLEAGPAKLNIVFNINADGTVTMDSPDQGAMGLPAEVKYLKDDSNHPCGIRREACGRGDSRYFLTDGTPLPAQSETWGNESEPSANAAAPI